LLVDLRVIVNARIRLFWSRNENTLWDPEIEKFSIVTWVL